MKFRAIAIVAALALAACSGGGTSSAPAGPGAPPVAPTATPSSNPGGGSTPSAKITFTIPAKAHSAGSKQPSYISPDTTQFSYTINSVNGGVVPSWVTSSATIALDLSNCSGSPLTCTIAVPAPPGTVNYTFSMGDGTNTLSTVTTDETVVANTANNFTVHMNGIVASVSLLTATLAANSPAVNGVAVTALDADGDIIGGTAAFAYPITLTDLDQTGSTKLSVDGGPESGTVVVDGPTDGVIVDYSGQTMNSTSILASGTGISGGGALSASVDDITFDSGTALDDAAHGGLNTDPNWGQQTVFFAQASGTQGISASELGFTNAPYSQSFDITAPGCSGIASFSAGPDTGFNITALGVGVCSARLTEHGTGYPINSHPAQPLGIPTVDGTFWISVTSSSFGINHSHTH